MKRKLPVSKRHIRRKLNVESLKLPQRQTATDVPDLPLLAQFYVPFPRRYALKSKIGHSVGIARSRTHPYVAEWNRNNGCGNKAST